MTHLRLRPRPRFRTWDELYCPGTQVLRNKLGLTDAGELARAERALSFGRIIELRSRPQAGTFDLSHLQSIHRHLFQDLYQWAGQLRRVPAFAAEAQYCQPGQIRSYATEIFGHLAGWDYLRGLDRDTFGTAAAELLCDLTALHPFCAGNGCSQRVLLEQLAEQAGHRLSWPAHAHQRNRAASIASLRGDTADLRSFVADSLTLPPQP
jgi:cell filamentation protein